MSKDSFSENDMIKRFLAGDMFAFEALVERYQQRIYNFSLRMVQNPQDAFDLTQEIFIILLKKIHSFRGESKFSTWLYSVACNTCKDFLRRKKPVVSLSDAPFLEDAAAARESQDSKKPYNPVYAVERTEITNEIEKALLELSEEYRIVIILHDIQRIGYNEIAESLGISIGTVKSRLSRARSKLAKRLFYLREQL